MRVYNQPGKQLTVLVYNARGQRVYMQRMVTSAPYTKMDVDMRNVADGDYFVTVVTDDNEILGTTKVLIAK